MAAFSSPSGRLRVKAGRRGTRRANAAPHERNLSKLREAMLRTVPEDDWDAQKARLVGAKLAQLQSKWKAADDEAPMASQSLEGEQVIAKGIRRIGDALEYDYSVIDEPSDGEGAGRGPSSKTLPREVKYFDTASINVKAGDGGDGCCAFRREKFVAHGGPSGGNGGDGGSVWVVADEGMNALMSFRNKVHWKGECGTNGQGKDMHGANAKDLFISVPPGTIVRRKPDLVVDGEQPPLAELLNHGDKALLLQGGRGGRGNAAFKSAKNKAPIIAEEGERGEEVWLDLELKLVADVGIIGVPNAGKSTLLSVLSSAKPKIADYPFTTLVPNLGVCEMDYQTTVFADVPGLIEGAHAGEGLGHEFLRHCSRARTLVHVIDGTSPDPVYDYKAIRAELELFSPEFKTKPEIIAYNKVDVPDSSDYVDEVVEALVAECGVDRGAVVPISAVSGQGVIELVRRARAVLAAVPHAVPTLATDALNRQVKIKTSTDTARLDDYTIEAELAEERTWYVYGEALERFAQMTNWDYFEATLRFQRVLMACGLWKTLRARGIMEGDTVVIGAVEFSWTEDQSEGKLYEAWIDDLNARGKVGKGSQRWPHLSG